MLWYKGWLETRVKVLFLFVITLVWTGLLHPSANSKAGVPVLISYSAPVLALVACAILAGAGIATQPTLQATKGLHGSMLYTISLPVSRLRLLSVRVVLGWLEAAAIMGVISLELWVALPVLRRMATPVEMFEYAGTLIACSSMIYFMSVLLGTFLDEQWRVWGTMIGASAICWACAHASLPAFANILHSMGKSSPPIAHTMPWGAMAFSLGVSAALFFAALKIVRAREY